MKLTGKVLAFFCLVVFFAGCLAGKRPSNEVTVWHWMSDRDDVFRDLAGRFEKETGIRVRFELLAPSESYRQRIRAAAQTNMLPDIFGVLGEKRDFAAYIRSGFVKDLTEEMSKQTGDRSMAWKDTFFEKAIAVNSFAADNEFGVEAGIYGVPLDASTIQMIYNKQIYKSAGLDPEKPPLTWKEFVEHNRILKKEGYPGFVSGFGELWMIEAMASNWAMNLMGEEKVFDTYRGLVPYTAHEWVEVLNLFKQMADEGILIDGAVTMVNKTAEQTFVNERATYAFNGSWSVNIYRGMNPHLDYGSFPVPAISSARPMRVWGGSGSSLVVNNRSPRQEEAVRFLRWLTAEDQQRYLAQKTEDLPSIRAGREWVSGVQAQFVSSIETVTHPNMYPVHEDPAVQEAFLKGIQYILIGEKTPEEVAGQTQRLKEKELAKTVGMATAS